MSLNQVCALLVAGVVCAVALTAHADAGSPLSGEVKKIDGSAVDLAKYKGKVVLIVNVASQCGLTGQYAGLQKLYDTYKDKDFVILGFPANDFGAQEPGSDDEIKSFCSTKYGVTFDMFSKITVKGPEKAALYKVLTESSNPSGEVTWNFEKFLIGRDGKIAGRFKPRTSPDAAELVSAIEAEITKK
jgi:glutathione peroxidase